MTFEEFWIRQQYTDDADDKEFAREVWELSADLEREACAKICDERKWRGEPLNFAECCAEEIRMRANAGIER